MARRAVVSDERVLDDAARIASHLEAVRRVLRESISEAAQSYPVPVTPPQVDALQILVDELRASERGLSLSELSRRMGLAHSTVSGIVSRLERRDLVERRPDPDDRRFIRIELTDAVKGWVEHDLPAARLRPLAAAISAAGARERSVILKGLATLERLLTAS